MLSFYSLIVALAMVKGWENKNLIKDHQLAEYYGKLRTIVSGPIWSKERFWYILEFNFTHLGRYEDTYISQEPPYEYDAR